jgi:hypothetical protein
MKEFAMSMPLTDHARARLQQRGIPESVLESLLDFGREAHDHHGSAIVYFDHRARGLLLRAFGRDTYKRLESHLDAYAVVARDGSIVTVGHRTRRISRN